MMRYLRLFFLKLLILVSPVISEGQAIKASTSTTNSLALPELKEEGPTELKDQLSKTEHSVLDNTYFKVSYPKCYTIKQYMGDDELNTKTDPYISFIKGPECKAEVHDLKEFAIQYYLPARKDPKVYQSSRNNMFYKKKLKIQDHEATITGYVFDNYATSNGAESGIVWEFRMYCPKAKYNYLEARGESHRGKEVTEYLKKKDFKVPTNFEQILSTLTCK